MPPKTSIASDAGTPQAAERARPSATAQVVMPAIWLLTSFMTLPEPEGPRWWMRLPRASMTGRAALKSALRPPTRKVKLPALAASAPAKPGSPLETGASR